VRPPRWKRVDGAEVRAWLPKFPDGSYRVIFWGRWMVLIEERKR
jgi:hypothetical protein